MPFRPKNPVTITCEQCGRTRELKGRRRTAHGTFCSHRCSAAWHRAQDALTVWHLMELTRLLWESRPKRFKFKPHPFPGLMKWRQEVNATGKWIRELS